MSAVSIDHWQRVEVVANQIAAALQNKYPHITTEIVYDPPGGVSAWVRVEGVVDAEELEAITDSVLPMQLETLENEGFLILAI